jgi:hypothetical protein
MNNLLLYGLVGATTSVVWASSVAYAYHLGKLKGFCMGALNAEDYFDTRYGDHLNAVMASMSANSGSRASQHKALCTSTEDRSPPLGRNVEN